MNSPWTVLSTGNVLDACWKCLECGRVIFRSGEPRAWAHLQHCSHSPHRDEDTTPAQGSADER